MIESANHGSLCFDFMTDHDLESEEWLSGVCDAVESAESPVLVATPSHSLAKRISNRIVGSTLRIPKRQPQKQLLAWKRQIYSSQRELGLAGYAS